MSSGAFAVSDADVKFLLPEVTLFALAFAVAIGGALRLHLLVVFAHATAETLVDVVPQLRERARWARRAFALPGGRAGCPEVGPRGTLVAHQPFVLEGHPALDDARRLQQRH